MKVDASVITRWHLERGFLKIGYHYVILRNGKIEKGRKDIEVGAHVAGHNTGTLGICLVGGLNESTGNPEANYTDAQYESLRGLLTSLSEVHTKAEVLGHRDFPNVKKACPCFDANEWWTKAVA
jgi:N-acetylmuramoyl-L-alanine amidase